MTDLRTAAQQALEAMRCAVPTGKITLYEWDKAMADLDAALAQQAEPVQEPVAWMFELARNFNLEGYGGWEKRITEYRPNTPEGSVRNVTPLSPQRKPLTEEEIVEAVREADLDWQAGWTLDEHEPNRFTTLARAIEHAHGIGEEE